MKSASGSLLTTKNKIMKIKRMLCDACHARGYVRNACVLEYKKSNCQKCNATGRHLCDVCEGNQSVKCNFGHEHKCSCDSGKVKCKICDGQGSCQRQVTVTVLLPAYRGDKNAKKCSCCDGKGILTVEEM